MWDALTTVANLIISFSMWLMWLLHHVMVMTIPEVKLVLLVRRSRIKRTHRVLMLHVWMHLVHFFAIHALTVCGVHSTLLITSVWMPATHTSCTSRRIIRNTVGSRVIRNLVAWMFGVVWHLTGMRTWMMHVWRWTSYHMRVTRVIFMWHSIVSMGHIVMTLHNRIWIVAMVLIMLPVRTRVVHLAILVLVYVSFTHSWGCLPPMTTIWTIFCPDRRTDLIHSTRTVVNVILTRFWRSRIQICWIIFTVLSVFMMIMLISRLVLFWSRLILIWRGEVPRTVSCVNHGWLVYMIRIKFVLPQRLHVVPKLTCNRRRPPVVCTIINFLSWMLIFRVLNVFWRRWLNWLLWSTLDYSRRKLSSWRGWRLGSSSGVFWAVRSLRRFRLLELVPLASVVLRSISAFVRIHSSFEMFGLSNSIIKCK